jgi:DNA end-binding protein Ku
MARSIWTGAIGFGLVRVPVRLYSATQDKNVHFHQLQEGTGKRIRYQRVTNDGEEVAYEDIVRGYEIKKGKYVTLTDEELAAAEPEKSRTIEIEDFVDLHEIDPITYEKTYYVFPDERAEGGKPFVLLRRALEESELVGIGRFVMREHEYLVTIRPYEGVLALETMFFADEVRAVKDVAEPPKNVRVADRELEMARRLIDSLTTAWEPSRYRDTHRERLLDVIHRKAKGEEIVAEEAPAEENNVVDLMEVLRASLERGGKRPRRGAAKPTAKQAAKKTAKRSAKRSAKQTTKKTAKKTATGARKARRRAS